MTQRVSKPVCFSMIPATALPIPPRRAWPNGSCSGLEGGHALVGEPRPFRDDDDPVVLARGPATLEDLDDVGDVDRHLGDEDIVGRDGDAGEAGDPAGMPAHRLDDHDPAVALGGGPEPIDGFGHDVDGRVEPEGEIGDHQVVVDRLGDADQRQLEVVDEAVSDAQGIITPDGDQDVELERLEVRPERRDVALGVLVGIRSRGAEDRTTARDDAVGLLDPELAAHPLDEPAPAFEDTDAGAPLVDDPLNDGADDRVKAGAVAAAGQ